MSILATTLPCAGTVPVELPVLNLTPGVQNPASSPVGTGVFPTGPQFLADHSATPLNTVIQQPDGQQPTVDSAGNPLAPTTPTATPNTTTWLTDLPRQVILTEPF